MSSKSRPRSGSIKDKAQLPSIPASPVYDYNINNNDDSTQPSSADVDSKVNTNNNESRFSAIENSIAAMQASLNQLIALQLPKSNVSTPRSSVEKTQPTTVETEVKVTSHVDPLTESTQASIKPSEFQNLVSGLSQLLTAFRISPMDPNSIGPLAPIIGAANINSPANKSPLAHPVQVSSAKLEPYTSVIPPLESTSTAKVEQPPSPSAMKITTFTNCNNVITGASNSGELKSTSPHLSSPLEAKYGISTLVDNPGRSTSDLSLQNSPQIGASTQLYGNSLALPSQWQAPISPSIPTKPKPAAIELKAELPSKAPKLPGNGSPKPEEFMQWLSQIVDHIEAVPKLRPILLEPAKGWREFKRINSKFSADDLESEYLNAHRTVWAFISGGLEDQTRLFMKSELEHYSKSNNLPDQLGFTSEDDEFYKNCYELKRRLIEKYGTTSRYRAVEIQNDISKLHMKANEDPQLFFNKWNLLHLQLRSTTVDFNMPSEEQQVTSIITRLPKELQNSLKPVVIANNTNTVKALEIMMRNWYQSNQANGTTDNPYGTNKAKQGDGNKPKFGKSMPKTSPSTPAAAPVHAEGQNKPAPNRGNGSKPKQWNKQNNNQHHRPASCGNQVEGHKSNLQPIEDLVGGSTLIANAEDESSNVVTSSSVANPVSSTESIYKHDVVIDTGSSINLTGQGDKLKNIKESKSINVTTINGAGKSTSNRTGILPLNGKYSLDDVAYVPNSTFTLLSVGRLCNGGLQAVFTKHGGAVLKPRTVLLREEDILFRFTKKNNIYVIENALQTKEDVDAKSKKDAGTLISRNSRPSSPDSTSRSSTNVDNNLTSQQARAELNRTREARRVSFNVPEAPAPPTTQPSSSQTASPPVTRSKTTSTQAAAAISSAASDDDDGECETVNIHSDSEYTDSEDDICDDATCLVVHLEPEPPTDPDGPAISAPVQTEAPASPAMAPAGPLIIKPSPTHAELWHARFAHTGVKSLRLSNDYYNLHLSKSDLQSLEPCTCNVCLTCKTKRTAIGHKTADRLRVANAIQDCWHVDLIGPFSSMEDNRRIRLASLDGHSYALVIVDEYSRFTMVQPLQRKSDAADALISTIKLLQVTTSRTLKRLHSDGGGEFINKNLQSFLSEQGTELTTTTPHTPALNGIAESKNKKLTIKARCMQAHADAPLELWSLAYQYAAQIDNMLCQPAIQSDVPASRMFGTTIMNVDHFKVFGCDAYALIEEGKRGKLQSTAIPGIFVGWSRQYNAYKILLPKTLEVIISRNVKFNETSFDNLQKVKSTIMETAQSRMVPDEDSDSEYVVESIKDTRKRNGKAQYLVYWKGYRTPTWEPVENLSNCKDILHKFLKSRLKSKSRSYVANVVVPSTSTSTPNLNYIIPQSYNEAIRHPDSTLWEVAIGAELDSLAQQCVFTPATPPPGRKAIGCRWVFDTKRDSNNIIVRHKARLVVQGFKQKEGIDYFETFSPTVKIKSIKYLLAIAAQEDLEIKQLDFVTAFLNASLKEDIYINIPQGYTENLHGHTALKLNKALYGLKQASREWWLELDQFLNSLGYHASALDECLYMKVVGDHRIYLTLYVDDTLAIYPKNLESTWLEDKAKIAAKFQIKDLGDCEWILHMELKRDRLNRIITLTQKAYIEKVLQEHGMDKYTTHCIDPFLTQDITVPPDKVQAKPLTREEHETYRSIVGSLLYAANITRVDIAYIVGVLARYCSNPMNYHLMAARKVLRYLRGTTDYQLIFKGSSQSTSRYNLVIYTDSSWGDNKDDRKGTGGHLSTINGCPIAWQSKKHSTTPLSSTEAEYYALSSAVREALFLRQWFRVYRGQLLQIPIETVEIKCDNVGAIHMSDHSTNHNRTKHVDIQHYFIREHVHQNKVRISYIKSADQLADILTKAMKTPNFRRLTKLLMNTPKQ
jgi:hypothetical protein